MLKASLHLTLRSFNLISRIALAGSLLLVLLVASVLLTIRYWVLPHIERYHYDITEAVSTTIGQPVTIGAIDADWDGFLPHLSLADVRILDRARQDTAALKLQHVYATVSWMTLLRGEVRLHSLELDRPDLLVRRDTDGKLYVAGVALSGDTSDNGLTDWLLRQTHIGVRDARITWEDDQRGAPSLVFERVNLLIENKWKHHRFAVRAVPPAQLSGMLDVRGDFTSKAEVAPDGWLGQVYTQFDDVDVAAWRPWLKLPRGFHQGRGAMRAWLDVGDGRVSGVTADLALAGVKAQLGVDLPQLNLSELRGRVGWKSSGQQTEVETHKLTLLLDSGLELHPTDFRLRYAANESGDYPEGEIQANSLDLTNLAILTDYLPLEQKLKDRLTEFSPRGKLTRLQAKWQDQGGQLRYEVNAGFEGLSLQRTERFPGFSHLTGEVSGNNDSGQLSLDAHELTMDAPQTMPEPLAFDSLKGKIDWRTTADGTEISFDEIDAANADAAGKVSGRFLARPDQPGVIDLNIDLTRAAIQYADRYIPIAALDEGTHHWLRTALVAGQTNDFRLRLKGDLKAFPFEEGEDGEFRIHAHVTGLELRYDPAWPVIDNGDATLDIDKRRLVVDAPTAMTMGTVLQKVKVEVPDLASADMALRINGSATGETAHSLDFIQHSPVQGYIDGITDGVSARQGIGTLKLSLDIPLRGEHAVKVAGTYRFFNNDIDFGDGIPVLYKSSGELAFDQASMAVRDASAQIMGGPAIVNVKGGPDGLVEAHLRGRTDMDQFRQVATSPVLKYLHGGSDWQADIRFQHNMTDVQVTSDLSGMSNDMPVPFNKESAETVPMRFVMKSVIPQQDVIEVEYGDLLGAKLLRRKEGENWVIKRGSVNFGGIGTWPKHDGVWFTGMLPQLSLGGWGVLTGASEKTFPFTVGGADMMIGKLDAYGHSFTDLRLNMLNHDDVYTVQLAGKAANGDISWDTHGKGKLSAKFSKLILGERDANLRQMPDLNPEQSVPPDNPDFPELDITVGELAWKDRQLGSMEMKAQYRGGDWLLERMTITNPDGVLSVDGKWGKENGSVGTHANLKLDIKDAGNLLSRTGYPNSVRKGNGTLEAAFNWPGGPEEFDYGALNGTLKINAKKGQFLKIDPGIGKLLGILSLQALPRHITLDFNDVFSNGFDFDSIIGVAQVRQGVLTTDDFHIDGSAAKVTMKGQVDLGKETQDLTVRILPTLGNSVSLLGALAINPITGISTFIVNKILREPLDKLASFEYNVTGTWSEPNVVKAGSKQGNDEPK